MMEILPSSSPNVLAIRFAGKLTRSELESSIALVETTLEAPPVHFFFEVADFRGFETEGLTNNVKAAGRLIGKRERFGRIAVVADQDWLRWIAKAESALLPRISYEPFTGEERELALAWVEGRENRSHGPAIRIIETSRPDVLGFELNGKATSEEMEAAARHFREKLKGEGALRLFGRIRRLGGVEMGGLLSSDYFSMKRGFLSRLERYAVVGGPAWIRAMVGMMQPLTNVDIRHFEAGEEGSAWEWLGAEIVSERSLN
jgi:hypothetical protein